MNDELYSRLAAHRIAFVQLVQALEAKRRLAKGEVAQSLREVSEEAAQEEHGPSGWVRHELSEIIDMLESSG
jgi:hypothetical protein